MSNQLITRRVLSILNFVFNDPQNFGSLISHCIAKKETCVDGPDMTRKLTIMWNMTFRVLL